MNITTLDKIAEALRESGIKGAELHLDRVNIMALDYMFHGPMSKIPSPAQIMYMSSFGPIKLCEKLTFDTATDEALHYIDKATKLLYAHNTLQEGMGW